MRDLRVRFRTGGRTVFAVNGVSFDLERGQTLGVVGESGSGKSAMLRAIAGLLPASAEMLGSVKFAGYPLKAEEILGAPDASVATVFQDPATHLNPVQRIGDALCETLEVRRESTGSSAKEEAVALLERVELPRARERMTSYPHQLSGGMRQRVMIALALACEPVMLLADEPTTALDVTTQRKVLMLLKRLQRETGMAMVFVSHDLAVVGDVCDSVAVAYAGHIVERGPAAELLVSPAHPYSEGLIRSIPTLDPECKVSAIGGAPPDMRIEPSGCPFAPRCPRCTPDCLDFAVPANDETEFAACLHPLIRVAT
ncbi:MAG TPA: ABC transporter ATP-binding protein [Solirubrobacterales bacterium]|nr:ABC transporter ATP-binding protein [Solirubrobacterales bacterium]